MQTDFEFGFIATDYTKLKCSVICSVNINEFNYKLQSTIFICLFLIYYKE